MTGSRDPIPFSANELDRTNTQQLLQRESEDGTVLIAPALGLPDFQKAKPGHNLFSKKMLIVMLSNFKFVSITYRQNIQNT